jgi:hypothetical protein
MGVNAEGVHVFGVLHRNTKGDTLMTPVEASGYAMAPASDGSDGFTLTLSAADGTVVETFPPGTWDGVMESIPGIDAPGVEE